MVGHGPLLVSARLSVEALGLQERVHFLGVCTQDRLAQLMRELRGFVRHSMVAPDGDSEGNPVAVMEAQLSGLPVMATRHSGIPDLVLDGETGFLVQEQDFEGMAIAMKRLPSDPVLAVAL